MYYLNFYFISYLKAMKSEENKNFMNYFIEEVINNKNLDAANELVANDFIEQIPFPGQEPGRE